MSKKKELRQIAIKNILLERGKIRIKDLAYELKVTPETLRNDLNEMESMSLLSREHGFARIRTAPFEAPIHMRNMDNPDIKRKITFAAIHQIQDGQIVFLDAGSTVLQGAAALQTKKDLTVVTNSIPLVTQCIAMNINTIVCGGYLFNAGARTYGNFASNIIDHLNIDIAIMGTDGIEGSSGFTTINRDELNFKRHVMNQSKKLIAVCDHNKLSSTAPYIFCKFSEFDTVVTSKLTPKQREIFKDIHEIIEI